MNNNDKELTLHAPFGGPLVPLAQVPDPVFAEGTLGDGVAIDPLDDCLQAPCDGEIVSIARARHALTLRADNGSEWLMHVGIDSVKLDGEGFEPLVRVGQRVRRGDALLRFDLDRVARHSHSLVSPIVLVNGDSYCLLPVSTSVSVRQGDPLLRVVPGQDAGVAVEAAEDAGFAVGTAHIAHPGGLHARPAALMRKTAQRFAVRAELRFDGKRAPVDSLTGLLGLGIGERDRVEVACQGPDREAALRALLEVLAAPAQDPSGTAIAKPAITPVTDATPGTLRGVCAAPGLASGMLHHLGAIELPEERDEYLPDQQRAALVGALEQVHGQIVATLSQHADDELKAIFDAHLAMLEDPLLLDAAHALIEQRRSAAHAWSEAVLAQCAVLEALDNPLLAERANDLRDLRQRVLRVLLGEQQRFEVPRGAIVAAREVTPSDLLVLAEHGVAGLCMADGGATSHVAIIARNHGLPCAVALGPGLLQVDNAMVVLDADNGRLELEPSSARLQQVADTQHARRELHHQRSLHAHQPARTRDGVEIEVSANAGSARDAEQAASAGADGIGLLRTEFLFVDRREAPSDDEQRAACQAVLDAIPGKPVVIRTIDVGGDKQLDYLPSISEANPVLGLRGVRLGQQRPDLLDAQLRALLSLNAPERCRILLPMVSEVSELLAVRRRLTELARQLGQHRLPALGVMIEVPSAALLAGQLAEHADFLSIGTNDLAQYTLAMDRDHAGLAGRVDALHPAVLRLIGMACEGAAVYGRPVAVCGALASEPLATPILLGLGVRELSVSPPQVAEIKARVRELDISACQHLARTALSLPGAEAVREVCRGFAVPSAAA